MYPRIACSEEVNQGQTCMALVCLQQSNTVAVSNYKDCPPSQIKTVLKFPQNTKFYNLTSGTNTTCFVSNGGASNFVSYTVNNNEKLVWKILSGLSWGFLGILVAPLLIGTLILLTWINAPNLKQRVSALKKLKLKKKSVSKEQMKLTPEQKATGNCQPQCDPISLSHEGKLDFELQEQPIQKENETLDLENPKSEQDKTEHEVIEDTQQTNQ